MTSYRQMDNRGNEQPTCFCGPFKTNVQQGAFVIALVGGIINLLQAIAYFLPDSATHHHHHNVALGVLNSLTALMYFSIILAQYQRNQLLFLPYLICVGIWLVATTAVCLVALGLAIEAPQSIIDEWNREHPSVPITREDFRAFMIGYFFIYGVSSAMNGWFYSVVYRAYKSLKNQLPIGKAPHV